MHIYKLCTSCSKGQPFTANDNYLFYYPCHINRESCDALCMFMCVCMHTHRHTHAKTRASSKRSTASF